MVQAASHAGRYPGYWPALQLLVEIELEVGSQDSHLRALNRLQTFCGSMQALLEGTIAASGAESQTLWYMPSTWLGKWMKKEDSKVQIQHGCHSCPVLLFSAAVMMGAVASFCMRA